MLYVLGVAAMLLLPLNQVAAEEWTCSYRWTGKTESHPMLIEIGAESAITRGGFLNSTFRILDDSKDELIIIETNTKQRAGKDYPVGATLIVLDKSTGKMVRSNTHTDESFNSHAVGSCSIVLR